MARIHHRVFEIYDQRDEAGLSLISKTGQQAHNAIDPGALQLQQLNASRESIVICLDFKQAPEGSRESIAEFKADLDHVADKLTPGSKVLVDFSKVETLPGACVDALAQFRSRIRPDGSRVVLCGLQPAVREVFFEQPAKTAEPPRKTGGRQPQRRRGKAGQR